MTDTGRLIAGRYRLRRHIGSGGMGVVWKAEDEQLGRIVAVKRLSPQTWLNDEVAEETRLRTMREGRMAARLQHPSVVAVHDVIDDDGQPALVMEYVPSRSLANVLEEHGPVPPREAARIGAQVAAALTAAHDAGIVHRDVKPGNVLLIDDGLVKITDFGISWAADEATITQTGTFPGTTAYLSPEVANGHEPGPASDVFSLGSTIYAAVEGAPPFGEDGNSFALLRAVATGQIPPPQHAGELTTTLLGMLADDPAARLTMAEAADALQAVAEGRVPEAAPVTAPTAVEPAPDETPDAPATRVAPATRPRRTRRRGYVVAAVALVLVLAGALLIGRLWQDDPRERPQRAGPAQLEWAVTEYYALLPERAEDAWTRLGPRLQQPGKRAYQRFWGTVRELEVITAPRATGSTVLAGIELTMKDGARTREFHQLGMIHRNGRILIGNDDLVHAEDTPPPGTPVGPAPVTSQDRDSRAPAPPEVRPPEPAPAEVPAPAPVPGPGNGKGKPPKDKPGKGKPPKDGG